MFCVFLHKILKVGTTWYKIRQHDQHKNNLHYELILINISLYHNNYVLDLTHLKDLGLLSVLEHQMVRGVHHLPSDLGDLVVQNDLANLKGPPILVRLEFQEDLDPPSLQEDLEDQATLDRPVDLAILLSQVHLHKTDNFLK
jgi:hypothetical protein